VKENLLTKRAWVLLIVTALLCMAGALNFQQRLTHTPPPTDGVEWRQVSEGRILAQFVDQHSAAGRDGIFGILPGDRLIAISYDGQQYEEVTKAYEIQIYLEEAGVGGRLFYLIERDEINRGTTVSKFEIDNLLPFELWRARDLYLNLVGVVYLLAGLFILFKQGSRAPFVIHFATFCLVAFVFHFYKPYGAFEGVDNTIAFLDNVAYALFAPLFFHFCAIYPVRRRLFAGRRWLSALLYAPAVALILLTTFIFSYWPEVRLDRSQRMILIALSVPNVSDDFVRGFYTVQFVHFWSAFIMGMVVLMYRFFRSGAAIVRQQLKWVVWGSALAVTPFTLLYALPYLFNVRTEDWLMDAAVAPLILIPLAFGNSVMRYRPTDVDIVYDGTRRNRRTDSSYEPLGIKPTYKSSPLDTQFDKARDPYRIAGTVLNQRYELKRYAGSGGMGAVYQAIDNKNSNILAVKVLKPDLVAKNPEYIELFDKEVKAVQQLKHRNIVEVLDNGIDSEIAYMVMEWLEGKSLEDVIAEKQLPLSRIIRIFEQICSAVAYAHDKDIIHLDLKPSNILVSKSEQLEDFVKVIDFGLARVISKESGTTVTRFRGTHQYCAPEQFGGRVSKRSDIYSLGATLYYLISGVVPFGTSYINAKLHQNLELPDLPSPTRPHGFPPKIDQVIIKALSKEPNSRQQTVRQLFEEFHKAAR
jgi:hypothetical protein